METPRRVRRAIRFPLEAPIVFWWTDTGVEKRSEGRTHDISETGAFVLAHTCPPSGIQIGVKVFLPMLPGSEPNARVEALGSVRERTGVGHGARGLQRQRRPVGILPSRARPLARVSLERRRARRPVR